MWYGAEDSVLGCVFRRGKEKSSEEYLLQRCAAAALDIPGDVMGGTGRS
jgi:hypothetical protein